MINIYIVKINIIYQILAMMKTVHIKMEKLEIKQETNGVYGLGITGLGIVY